MAREIRILSVDDHQLIHRAIANMASQAHDLTVVGEAQRGEEALEFIEALRPDVVLMDLNMPGIGGIAATERILDRFPEVNVIVVSAHTHEPYPSRALAAGARGFVSKDCDEAELLRAIRSVQQGKRFLSAEISDELARRLVGQTQSSPFERLSEREMEVVLQITAGRSTAQIAQLLGISTNTVSSFRRRIFDKLQVSNDVELTLMAFRHRLIGDQLDS